MDDDYEDSETRDIQIEIDTGQIEIESKLRQGSTVDEIEMQVKYDSDGVEIEVSYESEFTSENETEFEIEFSVTFRKLIEFVDQNANGIYEPAIDTTIQEVALNSFHPVTYSTSVISGNTTLHYLLINSTDGVFKAHLFVAEEFTILNETLITPTETKIDIEIENFNYLDMNSQLALYVKLESEAGYEDDDKTEDESDGYASYEDGVKTTNSSYMGFFTWEENATVDGMSKPVLSSTIEVDDDDELEQKLYLNYPRGTHIYHDPKVGIAALTSNTQLLPIILIGSILGILAAAGIVLVIIRKRK
ncbi:MAG: hypothetical protein KGD58_17450 [Candidatus Lokiarchaeota archaeon]|nr:hypothetical protein [Candidatus Lokiarchaeota archaeon]